METDGMAGEETSGAVTAYKGFDKNLVCNPDGKPFQYEIGKTYEHKGNVVRCAEGGFHACEHPLNVFSYYPPATSRYCEVQMSGQIARDGSDTKIASARITIGVEVHLHELIQRAVKWVFDRSKPEGPSATGRYGAASATGYQGAASATGDQGAASATGYQGAASATGRYGAASATGYQGKARASEGSALFLTRRKDWTGNDDSYEITHVWAGIAGRGRIKPDTWYTLDEGGQPVEVA
jgi:hypothetical protein